jgi:hypothetical protein
MFSHLLLVLMNSLSIMVETVLNTFYQSLKLFDSVV